MDNDRQCKKVRKIFEMVRYIKILLNTHYTSKVIITIFLILHCQELGKAENSRINIAGLYSGEDGFWNAEAVRTISDIAVEMIKETTILNGYELNVVWKTSQCDRNISLYNFLEFIHEVETTYHFIFGPSCSSAAEPVADIIPVYALNMLTSTSTSPGLTNENKYPNTILGVPTYDKLVVVYMKLIEKFEWHRIGLINQDTGIFNSANEILSDQLKKKGIAFDNERIVDATDRDEVDRKLERLVYTQGYRIIIANFYEDSAYQIFCRASKLKYIRPHITWIIPSWYSRDWVEENHNRTYDASRENETCSIQEIHDFIEGALGVDSILRLIDHNISAVETETIFKPETLTEFNITRGELWNRIHSKLEANRPTETIDPNIEKYAIYAFDAMVTLAKIFDNALKDGSKILTHFDYHDRNKTSQNNLIAEHLVQDIYDIEFEGLTGRVSYGNRSRKESPGEIVEFVNGKEVLVGIMKSISKENVDNIDTYQHDIEVIKEVTTCEKDGEKCDGVELHNLPIVAIVITCLFAACGIVFTVVFMIINLTYRKKKVVKLSSPLLNTIILSGALLQCIVAVLVVLDNRLLGRKPEDTSTCIGCTILCHLIWWLPALATDLIFGTLVGKAFRVYRIAIRKTMNSKVKNTEIFLFVSALLLLDTLYTIVWAAIPQIQLQFIAQGPLETGYNEIADSRAPFWYIFYCAEGGDINSPAIVLRFVYILFRWILYGVGLFIAYQIRNMCIKGVNEFQSITLATLATIFFNLFRIILSIIIPSVRLFDAAISLLSISYVLDTVVVVSFIFLPKLYYIVKDPKEDNEYGGVHNTSETEVFLLKQVYINNLKQEIDNIKFERDKFAKDLEKFTESTMMCDNMDAMISTNTEAMFVPNDPNNHKNQARNCHAELAFNCSDELASDCSDEVACNSPEHNDLVIMNVFKENLY